MTDKKKKKLPHSVRKHIREEKARIRREVWDPEEKKKKTEELLSKFYASDSQEDNSTL